MLAKQTRHRTSIGLFEPWHVHKTCQGSCQKPERNWGAALQRSSTDEKWLFRHALHFYEKFLSKSKESELPNCVMSATKNLADVREIQLVKTRIVGWALWYYRGGSRLLWWDEHPGYKPKLSCCASSFRQSHLSEAKKTPDSKFLSRHRVHHPDWEVMSNITVTKKVIPYLRSWAHSIQHAIEVAATPSACLLLSAGHIALVCTSGAAPWVNSRVARLCCLRVSAHTTDPTPHCLLVNEYFCLIWNNSSSRCTTLDILYVDFFCRGWS